MRLLCGLPLAQPKPVFDDEVSAVDHLPRVCFRQCRLRLSVHLREDSIVMLLLPPQITREAEGLAAFSFGCLQLVPSDLFHPPSCSITSNCGLHAARNLNSTQDRKLSSAL